MLSTLLLALGCGTAITWGIAHIVPTRNVVASFGAISTDNRRILTMEWVGEGLALVFVGLVPLLARAVGSTGDPVVVTVSRASAAMLLAMAAWTALTGSRTAVLPIKLCPVVKTVAAGLILISSFR
jgi:hypothetical protein